MTWMRAIALALALIAAPLAAQAPDAFLPETAPADLGATEAGELQFRGGVEIFPDKADIGGISSLEWHGDTLVAVTDDGRWVELTIEEVQGRLTDVSGVRLGPLRDAKGAKIDDKQRGDAEALTRLPSGEWLVAFEQQHRILRYSNLTAPATGDYAGAQALIAGAAPNEGIETLAAYPGGVLACGEWSDPARANCLRIGDDGTATRFALPTPEGIAANGGVPTDASCKADGTCYVLFRSYTKGEGNRAAIVALAPDNSVRTLAVLAPPLMVDNFEGLAVREEAGATALFVISDDNLSNCERAQAPDCQHTYLYKFALPAPPQAADPVLTARPGARPYPEAANVTVVLETTLGAVTIALETGRAPITAGNFLRYADEKRLDGTAFYRAMDLDGARQPSGLVQGGTRGDPRRVLPKIAHEATSVTGLSHTHGALSMAIAAPGDADGDFFIMIEDQTGFDADPAASDPGWAAGYAVFGYVTGGMDIVAKILAAPRDPQAGEGVMKGQMLGPEVKIISARRVTR
jgi:cyclophilin family peptidyl-prolyl cis-trans isomerase